ncbi:uncharacterized protein LOC132032620 isoform X2 [Lycium ferocissimum]|uniref:uncharacterized protein LOC132032620 isoform X2 n=1 Tax=Lycium ferocissimum TaxID=112874 RepID=UPI0028167943|nr:uncharacterized protein LOC132032620 isoform X2 [Lycium ferocissimum]
MVVTVRVNSLKPLTWTPFLSSLNSFNWPCSFISIPRKYSKSTPLFSQMATSEAEPQIMTKVIDSHLHVWASPQEAAEKYPYFPGQEPSLPGHVDYLLECMEEAGVDGALIVQPINHKFDHSYVTSALKKYPSKFVGCCLANPAEDGSGIKQLEDLVLEMTNEIGKALFSKAGELGVPVGFMCMKGLLLHLQEIEELCTEIPSTVVLLDHVAFCKPPKNDEERQGFLELLKLSRFPQVYVKFSALFRVSRNPYPYEDLSQVLAQLVSSYGAPRIMWGSDFPFIVAECGYREAREAVSYLAVQGHLPSSATEWIMGKTVMQLFDGKWSSVVN